MAGVVVFDFDKTIIDCDSDEWVVQQLDLFTQLLPTLPLNLLMDRMMSEACHRRIPVEEVADCLKKIPIHPTIISAIKSAHSCGWDLRIVSDSNVFFLETVLEHHGVLNCFSEINTNPSYVDAQGRLRILPYHDCKSSSHGCIICPPNMCKGLIVEKIRDCLLEEEKKQLIYVGDGTPDFCAALKLRRGDILMARRNYPVWELICRNTMLMDANVQDWSDGQELGYKLFSLTGTIFSDEKGSVRHDQFTSVDCKLQTTAASEPGAYNYKTTVPLPTCSSLVGGRKQKLILVSTSILFAFGLPEYYVNDMMVYSNYY